MSAAADKARRVLTGASYAITALEIIGELAGDILGKGTHANEYVDVLQAIQTAVSTFMKGLDGEVTPAAIADALAKLRAEISSNDAAANAAVDAKFSPK